MITIAQGEWIADLGSMVCRNINNGVVVGFEKSGKTLVGKIKDMSMELFGELASQKNGHKIIQKTVMDAEEVFLRAYIESDFEKNGIREYML